MKTLKQQNLVLCHGCEKINSYSKKLNQTCTRCSTKLHLRKPNSLEKTWALTVASIIAFIPAHTLPIMTVLLFGDGTPDTIMSGIILLVQLGMTPVAMLIFIASFLVPLGKIFALFILLLNVNKCSMKSAKKYTKLYRVVEFLGKWSMLDVFVVAIMAAVVQLGVISEIVAGSGATAFAIMVVLTMVAAHSFDPRLLWDNNKNE